MSEQSLNDLARSTREDELYAVICGYELDLCAMIQNDPTARRVAHPQIIADGLPFSDAAHILRTLLEKGESDMSYFMLPVAIYAHWADPNHAEHQAAIDADSIAVLCTYCQRSIAPVAKAIDEGWIPTHYATSDKLDNHELGPVCPECASKMLEFDPESLEHILKTTARPSSS